MRIGHSTFGKREGNNIVIPKYFLAFEGYKTEPQYFKGIQDNTKLLGITPLIDIHQIDRDVIGDNHPQHIVKNVSEYLKSIKETDNITYNETVDKVCIIVDRDKESFRLKQLRKVMQFCIDNNFKLFISNPCFEFWLLLHYDEVHIIDREKMKDNKKVDGKTFAEQELKRLCVDYQKGDFPVGWFMENIDIAIANAKSFAEDLEELKENIGSNIGVLITELRGSIVE